MNTDIKYSNWRGLPEEFQKHKFLNLDEKAA